MADPVMREHYPEAWMVLMEHRHGGHRPRRRCGPPDVACPVGYTCARGANRPRPAEPASRASLDPGREGGGGGGTSISTGGSVLETVEVLRKHLALEVVGDRGEHLHFLRHDFEVAWRRMAEAGAKNVSLTHVWTPSPRWARRKVILAPGGCAPVAAAFTGLTLRLVESWINGGKYWSWKM
ncbi:MAG: hypothetical protein ACLU9S_05805 [Oscillospiraceae bacterium]